MTEDDTFLKLAKMSFEDISSLSFHDELYELWAKLDGSKNMNASLRLQYYYTMHYWSFEEYIQEYIKIFPRDKEYFDRLLKNYKQY